MFQQLHSIVHLSLFIAVFTPYSSRVTICSKMSATLFTIHNAIYHGNLITHYMLQHFQSYRSRVFFYIAIFPLYCSPITICSNIYIIHCNISFDVAIFPWNWSIGHTAQQWQFCNIFSELFNNSYMLQFICPSLCCNIFHHSVH